MLNDGVIYIFLLRGLEIPPWINSSFSKHGRGGGGRSGEKSHPCFFPEVYIFQTGVLRHKCSFGVGCCGGVFSGVEGAGLGK